MPSLWAGCTNGVPKAAGLCLGVLTSSPCCPQPSRVGTTVNAGPSAEPSPGCTVRGVWAPLPGSAALLASLELRGACPPLRLPPRTAPPWWPCPSHRGRRKCVVCHGCVAPVRPPREAGAAQWNPGCAKSHADLRSSLEIGIFWAGGRVWNQALALGMTQFCTLDPGPHTLEG